MRPRTFITGLGALHARRADRAGDRAAEHQLDQLVLGQVGGRVGADLAAVAQDSDPLGDLEHLVQAVGYVEDAHAALAHAADRVEERVHLGLGQRGGRLVEHQQAGAGLPLPQGPGDRDAGAFRGGEVADRRADVEAEAERPDHLARRAALAAPPDSRADAGVEAAAQRKVLGHVQVVDQGKVLVDEAQPGGARGGRVAEADRLAAELHLGPLSGAW